ncbi:unnamed protein product [Gordionus sp. m RMFG-2023]
MKLITKALNATFYIDTNPKSLEDILAEEDVDSNLTYGMKFYITNKTATRYLYNHTGDYLNPKVNVILQNCQDNNSLGLPNFESSYEKTIYIDEQSLSHYVTFEGIYNLVISEGNKTIFIKNLPLSALCTIILICINNGSSNSPRNESICNR